MNELYHYGVKGMKWGVRNAPEPTGRRRSSYFRESRDTYKNAYIQNQSRKYQRDLGLSKKEADAKAARKVDIAKKVAIGASAAVAVSAGVYAARTISRSRGDDIIRKGTEIQSVKKNANRILDGGKFYTSFRNSDKTKYIGYFGKGRDGLKNKVTAEATSDIRIAGAKTGKKAFKNLLDTDPAFRHKFKLMSYKEFNKFELLGKTSQEGQKFIDKLSGMGYGGVADLNDRTMNYYHTKATVMFNNSNLKNFKVSQITNNEYTKAKVKAYLMGGADVLSHPISVATGVGVGGALALRKYDKQTKRRNKKK